MANSLLTPPPRIDPERQAPTLRPADAPHLNEETDGSMWTSLIANLRDAFSKKDEEPLQLESKPADSDFIIKQERVLSSLSPSIPHLSFPPHPPPLLPHPPP